MNRYLPPPPAGYTSQPQIVRKVSEAWVAANIVCPSCGQPIEPLTDNTHAADFICRACGEWFELKSKRRKFTGRIVNGAYHTLLERLQSNTNPNLFLLTYDHGWVTSFCVIPKFYFAPDIITARPPLGPNAKRAGWQGCTIHLDRIPLSTRLYYVQEALITPTSEVVRRFNANRFMLGVAQTERTWLVEVMEVIASFNSDEFQLADLYARVDGFRARHPTNKHIEAKIRQQLQILRDHGRLEFIGRGNYRRIS